MRALVAALAITSTVFFAELIGGIVSGSVALIADAMHMLSDAAGLSIAVIAVVAGTRAAITRASYGYRRAEVLAALINAEGGPDDIFVIPNYRIPKRFRHLVPFWRRVRSARASRSAEYTYAVRDRLLDGDARSGV